MSTKYKYPQWTCAGNVDNDNAEFTIQDRPGEDQYVHIEKLDVSIYKAAQGSAGKLRLQDNLGETIHTINVDGVKDISFDFGEDPGLKIGPDKAVQAILYGAGGDQAAVSIIANGHTSFGR